MRVAPVTKDMYDPCTYIQSQCRKPMARIHMVMPDEGRSRFTYQTRSEGLSLSAWMRAAAQQHLDRLVVFDVSIGVKA